LFSLSLVYGETSYRIVSDVCLEPTYVSVPGWLCPSVTTLTQERPARPLVLSFLRHYLQRDRVHLKQLKLRQTHPISGISTYSRLRPPSLLNKHLRRLSTTLTLSSTLTRQ
jgi:hypothetical protein